jgi:hypothetical protein
MEGMPAQKIFIKWHLAPDAEGGIGVDVSSQGGAGAIAHGASRARVVDFIYPRRRRQVNDLRGKFQSLFSLHPLRTRRILSIIRKCKKRDRRKVKGLS